jgi:hypothetical protein
MIRKGIYCIFLFFYPLTALGFSHYSASGGIWSLAAYLQIVQSGIFFISAPAYQIHSGRQLSTNVRRVALAAPFVYAACVTRLLVARSPPLLALERDLMT